MLGRVWRFRHGAFFARLRARFSARAAGPKPIPEEPAKPERRRLWALVQTRPNALVLAVSDSREDLERELVELNETWNHGALRTELRRYDIQPVCLLQTGRDPLPARASAGFR